MAYPGSTGEEREAAELLRNYRPKCFVSGHSHQLPYLDGSGWKQIVNGVQVLVPGQLLDAAFPNHIFLDTESGELSWQTTSQEWIPDDLLSVIGSFLRPKADLAKPSLPLRTHGISAGHHHRSDLLSQGPQ